MTHHFSLMHVTTIFFLLTLPYVFVFVCTALVKTPICNCMSQSYNLHTIYSI